MASHGGDRDRRELSRWSLLRHAFLLLGFSFGGWLLLALLGGPAQAAQGPLATSVPSPVAAVHMTSGSIVAAAPVTPPAVPKLSIQGASAGTAVQPPTLTAVTRPTPPVLPVLQAPPVGSGSDSSPADAVVASTLTAIFGQVNDKVHAAFVAVDGAVPSASADLVPGRALPAGTVLAGAPGLGITAGTLPGAGTPPFVAAITAVPSPASVTPATAGSSAGVSSSVLAGSIPESEAAAPPTHPAAPLPTAPADSLPAAPAPVMAGSPAPVAAQLATLTSLHGPSASTASRVSTIPVATLQDGAQPEPSFSPD